MHRFNRRAFPLLLVAVVASLLGVWAPIARAVDPAQAPVAVRWWGQALVTIETWWGLTIAIDPYAPDKVGYDNPNLSANLTLITHHHFDHNNPDLIQGDPFVKQGLSSQGDVNELDLTLDRLPNSTKVTLTNSDKAEPLSPHPVRIRSIPAWHDDSAGAKRGADAMFLIETDGVRILHCGDLGQSSLTDDQLDAIGRVDVLLIPVGGTYTVDGAQAAAITKQIGPRYVVPIHFKTDALTFDLASDAPFFAALGKSAERQNAVGNTLAVSPADDDSDDAMTIAVSLQYTPWQAPKHVKAGLVSIASARESLAKTVEGLSLEQFDHHPADGSHTVRWNAEHTAGAEMSFFTLVYHDSDSTMPLIRITPAQMPADYTPANPDWSPEEEANHIRRVGAFTERFAYLLDGVDPTQARYPAFFKSLDGLFKLIAGHYDTHHGHIKEKMALPDWPKH